MEAKIVNELNAEILERLYTISKAHDLAHILAVALSKCGKLGDDLVSKKFQIKAVSAVSHYERARYDLQTICDALEQAQIPYIPLKGSVLRQYYPEPWMRNSCDIDVLVRKENLTTAMQVLQDVLGYTLRKEGTHEFSFCSPSNVCVEMHFDLIEDGRVNAAGEILKDVWNKARLKENTKFHYLLSDEQFYYYHIAHMAKHFEQGGCGIRPFIDLWIMDAGKQIDWEKRNQLLQKGKLLKFARAAKKLSKIWFENEHYDHVARIMEEYVIRGGIFGTKSTRVTLHQKQKGSKWRYALWRILPPYSTIKNIYPILQSHPWMTPFAQIYRWVKIVVDGKARNAFEELTYSQNISRERLQDIRLLFSELGL